MTLSTPQRRGVLPGGKTSKRTHEDIKGSAAACAVAVAGGVGKLTAVQRNRISNRWMDERLAMTPDRWRERIIAHIRSPAIRCSVAHIVLYDMGDGMFGRGFRDALRPLLDLYEHVRPARTASVLKALLAIGYPQFVAESRVGVK